MKNMGGIGSMLNKMPGMGNLSQMAGQDIDDKPFNQMEAIINSMTPRERRFPDIINGSRKKRIAGGSGTRIQDVNRLLKQHKQMQKMMKKVSGKGGMAKLMRGMNAMKGPMGGGLPPGMGGMPGGGRFPGR
jgi:signal recognition particle subunit SRP54